MKTTLINALEQNIGYTFKNKSLLQTALTHSSATRAYNYERLEFLGDRVLGLVVAEMLYEKFPDEPEGHMAKRLAALVQGKFLAKMARDIDLGKYIEFSNSERDAGGNKNENILADVLEAVIGALYLDGGLPSCQVLITRLWSDHLHEMKAPPQHPKTALQEWTQKQTLGLPVYEIMGQDGPDHAPVFHVRLSIEGYRAVTATGKSRQEAEKKAAQAFLDQIDDE